MLVFAIILLFASPLLRAEPLSSSSRNELNALLNKLVASGCEFNRNGSWYTGAEARGHLQRKLEYLEDKKAVQSTEQFIDLAASTSSYTGRAYLVRCGSGTAVESRKWLMTELNAVRLASAGRAGK